MKINNLEYGGFIVSKNIIRGYPIQYSYREKSAIKELNGWTLYSIIDDDDYVNNSENFVILTAESVYELSPLMIQLYDAPYGTDICWQYNKKGDFIGFYDLVNHKPVTLKEIVRGR